MEQQRDPALQLPLDEIRTAIQAARTNPNWREKTHHSISPRISVRVYRVSLKDTVQIRIEIYLRHDDLTPDSIVKQTQTDIQRSISGVPEETRDRIDNTITAAADVPVLDSLALSLRGMLLGIYGDTFIEARTVSQRSENRSESVSAGENHVRLPKQFLCRCELSESGEVVSTGEKFTSGSSPFDTAGAYVFAVFVPARVSPKDVPQPTNRR